MILVEGQEITLKSKIDSLRNYKRELLEIRKDTAHSFDNRVDGSSDATPLIGQYEIVANEKEIKMLESIYDRSNILEKSNSETIEIGSYFNSSINFFGEIETKEMVLAETNWDIEGYTVISTSSPVGKAVLGKKENDGFSYKVNGEIITGTINKVYCDQKTKTIVK